MEPQGAEKRIVRVTIFQQPYSLRASGDPAETEAVAQGVDDLMNQIADRSALGDPARVAVLAALHLADKVRVLEARERALEERLGDVRQRLQESGQRADKAEKALDELEQAAHEKQSKNAAAIDERSTDFYKRLEALDERLAALLDDRSH